MRRGRGPAKNSPHGCCSVERVGPVELGQSGRCRAEQGRLGRGMAMSDGSWNQVARRLRDGLQRGSLTLAQAAEFYRDAPDEPLPEARIEQLVTETVRRARQMTEPADHWHLWIGASDRTGQRCITLHIAGIVGAAASVAQVRNTVCTPDWTIVSISSLDVQTSDTIPQSGTNRSGNTEGRSHVDSSEGTNVDCVDRAECSESIDWNKVYWEVTTPVPSACEAESRAEVVADTEAQARMELGEGK